MAVNAVEIVPREGLASGPRNGPITRFAYKGSSTGSETLRTAVANEVIVLEFVYLQTYTGGAYDIGIGDGTTGLVVTVTGSTTNVGHFTSDQFLFIGGGSATLTENNLLIVGGAGTADYIVAGYSYIAT